MERRRVEMVVPTLAIGGMEVMVASLARALARRGHDVGITCIEQAGPVGEDLASEGVRVATVHTPGVASNFRAPRLEAWLAKVRPDVVHCHSGTWLKAAHAARRAGVPRVVHTMHGLEDPVPWYSPLLMRLAARLTDWTVAVSGSVADFLTRRVGAPASRLVIVTNGIDVERFAPGPRGGALRKLLDLDDRAPLVGIVARLDPLKNHALLVDAFHSVVDRVPGATLAVIGDGPLRGALQARITSLGLSERVRLVGELRDMVGVYRDLDVAVLSSRSEGTSISLLEAMASGTPVVATAVGGSPDVVAHGRAGVQVPSEDRAALAEALVDLLQRDDRRRELAFAGRTRVVQHYSHEAMVTRYEELYGWVAGGVGAAAEEVPCVG